MVDVLNIAKNAEIEVAIRSGVTLIKIVDASKFLAEARRHNVRILGIEGFYLNDSTITPDMSAIADFSHVRTPLESINASENFVMSVKGDGDYWVEFVLE